MRKDNHPGALSPDATERMETLHRSLRNAIQTGNPDQSGLFARNWEILVIAVVTAFLAGWSISMSGWLAPNSLEDWSWVISLGAAALCLLAGFVWLARFRRQELASVALGDNLEDMRVRAVRLLEELDRSEYPDVRRSVEHD